MKETSPNTTIPFLPDRLNRQPTVYRNMTFTELVVVILCGTAAGFILGVLVMLLLNIDASNWPIIPTAMFIVGWLSVRIGGFYIARLKRGKPEAWLERFIELKLKPSKFILTNAVWSTKRHQHY